MVRLEQVQQKTSRMVRGVEYPIQKENLRKMGFSGLEKTKEEGEYDSSLLPACLQCTTEVIEPEI